MTFGLLVVTLFSQLVFSQTPSPTPAAYQYAPPPTGTSAYEDPTKRKGGLTDQEKIMSETFIHTQSNAEKIKEECARSGDTTKACQGVSSNDSKDALIQTAAKAYSMFMGFAGGDFKVDNPKENAKPEEKSATDYCKYVPMATEMLAMTYQSTMQQTIAVAAQAPQQEQQKVELYKVAETHEARAKSADIQYKGWMVTSACYVALVSTASITGDWRVWARMAAAGLLASYFKDQSDDERGYANIVKGIADELRGPGECNPVTERSCYCLEKTTANDPRYCLPQMYRSWAASKAITPVGCINSGLQADPQCTCLINNNCYDVKLGSMMSGPMGQAFAGSGGAQVLSTLMRGNLGTGTLDNAISGLNAKTRSSIRSDILPKSDRMLTGTEAKMAQEIAAKSGIPLGFAEHLVTKPMDGAAKKMADTMKSGKNNFSHNMNKIASYVPPGSRAANILFSEGSFGKKKGVTSQNKFDLSQFNQAKKKESIPSGTRILQLSEAAQQRASQITQDSDRPLFQIISHRYMLSGWRQLELTK